MEYRIKREVHYRLAELSVMPQIMRTPQTYVAVDFGKPDEQVTTMAITPSQTMTFRSLQEAYSRSGLYQLDPNALKQLVSGSQSQEASKNMNVVKRIKNLGLSKEDKLLRKYQMVDQAGDLTADGKEAIWTLLFDANKAALVTKLKQLETDEKTSKKRG